MAITKTGSGKTLGYLIPAFILLRRHHNNAQNGLIVLALAPPESLPHKYKTRPSSLANLLGSLACACMMELHKNAQLKESLGHQKSAWRFSTREEQTLPWELLSSTAPLIPT